MDKSEGGRERKVKEGREGGREERKEGKKGETKIFM